MITTLDTQSWSKELLTGNAGLVEDLASVSFGYNFGRKFGESNAGTFYVVSNTRAGAFGSNFGLGFNGDSFAVLKSNNVPPDPGPGFTFDVVAGYTFPTKNTSFDPVVTYDTTGANPLIHIIGTRDNPANPRLVDLIKFTFDTVALTFVGPQPAVLVTGSDIRSGYDIAVLNNAVTGGGINHKLVAASVDNALAPPLFVATITNIIITNNVLTVTANNVFASGQLVTLSGLTTATFLEGRQVNVTAVSATQFSAAFPHPDYGGFGTNFGLGFNEPAADTGSVTPNFTGESLIAFELNSSDAPVGTLQVLANSPLRSGNTFSSVSLISPDGVNAEVYWESHPKGISFTDQNFAINQTNRLGQTPITATSITSNVLTVTARNNFVLGTTVVLTGTAEAFLNSQTITVLSASSTQFTASFTHANFSNAVDTGLAITTTPVWDAAPAQLTSFQGRYTDNRLTAIMDASGNRYLSQTYFTQTNHPEGLTGNLILGSQPASPANSPWFFHITLGSAAGGSIVQSALSISQSSGVNLTYLLQPFEQIPPPAGLPAASQFRIATVSTSSLAITDVPGFYNALTFTWLRGAKTTIDDASLWAAVGERQVLSSTAETYLISATAPYVIQIANSRAFWQNTSVVDNSGLSPRTFTQAGASPAEGQYTVAGQGVYTFNASDASVGITGISIVGDSLTVSGTNVANLSIGMQVMFSGLTTSTYLNGQKVTVTQINAANGTFGGTFIHADDLEHADTGLVGRAINITYNYISSIVPVFVSLLNVPPVAAITPNTLTTVFRDQPLLLSAAASTDADQDPLEYIFTENDPDLVNVTLNSSGATALLNVSKTIGGNQQAHITNVVISAGVVTLTAINTFTTGQIVLFKNLLGAAFLNGHQAAVLSTGLSGTQFKVNDPTAHGPYTSTADNGDAGVSRTFSVGVAVVDLFSDLTTPRHPADLTTALQISSGSSATVTASNAFAIGEQAMAYSVALGAPVTPTYGAAVASGVFASPITNVTVSVTGFLTVVANNNLVAGMQVTFSGLTTATFLNGQTVTVADATATQFDAVTAFSTYGPAAEATGRADFPPATTYYTKLTYVNPVGESLASVEAASAVGVGFLPVVNSPIAAANATTYNVYMSVTAGNETLQTPAAPVALGTNYQLTVAGIISGPNVPATGNALLEVINDQALTIAAPITGTQFGVTGVFGSTFSSTAVTGFVISQPQFATVPITVPFNAIPTITFPSPQWSAGPQINVARGTALTITPGVITSPSTQFPVVITGVNDTDDTPTYLWEQISGTSVSITSLPTSSILNFTTNGVNTHGEALVFQLTVNDGVNPAVVASCTVNVAAYNFSNLDTKKLSRSVWNEQTTAAFVQLISNTLTIVAPQEFVPNQVITFQNFTFATFLNNQNTTVSTVINTPVVSTITQVQRSATLVTVTANNTFIPNEIVTVAATPTTGVNGTFRVLSATGTQFTYNTVSSGTIAPTANTGTATAPAQFTGLFVASNYPLAADSGSALTPARISQRNESKTWGALDISTLFSNLGSIKRTSALDGTDRYIVISPFSVLVYGGITPNVVLLRKLLTPGHTSIADAVHAENDETLVLDTSGNLFLYSTAPLINTDNPDTTINLSLLSSLSFDRITATYAYAGVRVVALSGPDGCLLLQLTNGTLLVEGLLEITVASNLLYGANNVQFVRTAGVESLKTGKVLLGTVLNAQATVTQVQVSTNALTLTCNNSFLVGDDILLSGFTGPTAFLNGGRITVVSQSPTEIIGSLQTGDLAPTASSGLATSDTDGQTFETLIDLPHGQIIGTWDASKLRNQFVNTGEILFEPDSTYSGYPIAPVQNAPVAEVTSDGTLVTISWEQERPDLTNGYGVEYSNVIADNTQVPASLSILVPGASLFGQDFGVVDVSGTANITQVQITSNVLTVTAANNFQVGNIVAMSGLTTATFLNGVVVTVLAATGVSFTATFTHADYGPQVDAGLATSQINHALIAVPANVAPGAGQYSVNTGAYTFNSAQQNDNIVITFATAFQLLQNINSGTVQKLITALPSGTYQFRIRAFSADGISNYSNIQTITF